MTINPRIPTIPGRSTPGFHQPGRHCWHQGGLLFRCLPYSFDYLGNYLPTAIFTPEALDDRQPQKQGAGGPGGQREADAVGSAIAWGLPSPPRGACHWRSQLRDRQPLSDCSPVLGDKPLKLQVSLSPKRDRSTKTINLLLLYGALPRNLNLTRSPSDYVSATGAPSSSGGQGRITTKKQIQENKKAVSAAG